MVRTIAILALAVLALWHAGGCGSQTKNVTLGGNSRPQADGSSRIELPHAERALTPQRRGDWCWAACCEMAFKYNGINNVTQETLVEKYKGQKVDQRAMDNEIVMALASDVNSGVRDPGRAPQSFRIDLSGAADALYHGASMYSDSDSALADFSHGHPVILGLRNWEGAPAHIVFVTAVELTDTLPDDPHANKLATTVNGLGRTFGQLVGGDASRYRVDAIEFYDPMPETGGPTRITGAELKEHKRFFLSRQKAREVMAEFNRTLQVH